MWIVVCLLAILFVWWLVKVFELKEDFETLKNNFDTKLKDFYHSGKAPIVLASAGNEGQIIVNRYNTVLQEINDLAQSIEEKNKKLTKLNPRKNQAKAVSEVMHSVQAFERQMRRMDRLSTSQMMDASNYGKINKPFWQAVQNMTRQEAKAVAYEFASAQADKETYGKCVLLNPEQMLQSIWFFAFEKPYSVKDFDNACELFESFFKRRHFDCTLAKFYAMKQIGGEDAIRDTLRSELQYPHNPNELTLLASCFMWMNAYQSENTVLQYMLTSGKEMTEKTQERLHSLTNGGGKAPTGFDVQSSASFLYFDVSALAWKDDEYIGLFENLAFQDKTLAYSLAVQDENKDLFIPNKVSIPDYDVVLNKFKSAFSEEYGSCVTAKTADCVALSGAGEETMKGILVTTNEFKQMGILIYIARIGKKLIIKFYTLFMPTSANLAMQKQQALSMYKKLSPSISMWESSLKDTMLLSIEQLLNTSAQASQGETHSEAVPGEPIF